MNLAILPTQPAAKRLLVAILLGHFLLAAAFSAINPLGEAPDEADHWAYIVHLANERSLLVGPRMTQSKHPPLYHASAALVALLADPVNDFLRPNADVELAPRPDGSPNFFVHTKRESFPWQGGVLAWHLVRLWSALLSTVTVAATFVLARLVWQQSLAFAFAATAMLAFLPEFAFIGSAANNDNAAALFGTLSLCGAFVHLHQRSGITKSLWTALALGLGLLAKTSTLALWPIVGLAILSGSGRLGEQKSSWQAWLSAVVINWRNWLTTSLLVFLPAILIASPWLLRNWWLYGDLLGWSMASQTIDLRTTPWTWADTVWLLRGWFITFWGKFGAVGHIPMANPIYLALSILTVCSVVGLLWQAIDGIFSKRIFAPQARRFAVGFLLLLLALLLTAAGIWQYSLVALGTDQGRLLYPAVAAIVLLWVAGLFGCFPQRYWAKVATVLSVGMLLCGLYGLLAVLMPAFAAPVSVAEAVWQPVAVDPVVTWQEIDLIGWQLEPAPMLFWRANRAPTQDWRVTLRLLDANGALIWEWQRSPGAGRWSSDHWQSGSVISDNYAFRFPREVAPGVYHLLIGLQPDGMGYRVPTIDGVAVTSIEQPFFTLGEVRR